MSRSPLELAGARARPGTPESQLDVVAHQVAEHGSDGTQFVELVEDHADDMLDLLVWVQLELVAGTRADIAGRGGGELLTAAGLVQPRLIEPLSQEVQLGLAHCPLEPQQQPVVVQGRVVDAVHVGQERVKDRTPLQEMVPVGVGARQSANLETKDDPDVIEVHLGQDPLEPGASLGRRSRF